MMIRPIGEELFPRILGDVHSELARSAEYNKGGWSDGALSHEEGAFLWGLTCVLRPKLVVETGTDSGYSATWIGNALRWLGAGRLITIELDEHKAKSYRQRLPSLGLDGVVTVIHGNSVEVPRLLSSQIDLAFIDGGNRIPELDAVLPFMDRHAVAVLHDTSPEHPLCKDQLMHSNILARGLRLLYLPSPRGMAVVQKG